MGFAYLFHEFLESIALKLRRAVSAVEVHKGVQPIPNLRPHFLLIEVLLNLIRTIPNSNDVQHGIIWHFIALLAT